MQPVSETLEHSENLATLCELQRDIVGFDNLVQPGRKFIRHGCLLKHSKKGYQQRMFFLVIFLCLVNLIKVIFVGVVFRYSSVYVKIAGYFAV